MQIAHAEKGQRNYTLNRESFSIGQLVKAGHLDATNTLNEIEAAARACGLDEIEIYRTAPRAMGDSEARDVKLDPTLAPKESNLGFTPQPPPVEALGEDTAGEEEEGTPAQTEEEQQAALEAYRQRQVQIEAEKLRITNKARALVAKEEAAQATHNLDELTSLTDFLAIDYPETQWVFEGLQPTGTRSLLAAQAKAGKTTTVTNVIKSLADRGTFLGKFHNHFTGNIALLDDELDPKMLQRWLKKANITNTDHVNIKTLRGRLGMFAIVDDDVRATWARMLTGTDYLILDCLRPVLDANGLDENREAGVFLNAFDALLEEANIENALVVHHMGHGAARSRGDSRIIDWPDVTWKLTRDDPDDMASKRSFSAFGREVDVDPFHVRLNGQLLLAEGHRPKNTDNEYMWVIQTIIWDYDNNPTTQKTLHQLKERDKPGQRKITDAIKTLAADGVLQKFGPGYVVNTTSNLVQESIGWTP